MQALIDFDGWRKWKDFSQQPDKSAESEKDAKSKAAAKKKKANRASLGSITGGSTNRLVLAEGSAGGGPQGIAVS